MRVLLLVAAAAAMILFGFYVMKKLDCFLEENRRLQAVQMKAGENSLRIGFSNPMVSDSIAAILETYSKRYPDVAVCLFSGTDEKLIEELTDNKLDVIFLPDKSGNISDEHFNSRRIALKNGLIAMKDGALPIEPIVKEPIEQRVLWVKSATVPQAECFVECLRTVPESV